MEQMRVAAKSRKMKEGSSDEPVLPDVHGDAARSLLVGLVEDPGEGERLLANLKTKKATKCYLDGVARFKSFARLCWTRFFSGQGL